MERIFSILTRETIKKHVASLLVVVLMLSQSMVAGAEVGSFTGESKRIKSTRGCQHNCWTDEGCQELLWQIMNTDPEAYEEIREEMLAYGWDDSGYGPGFATDSDADEIENTEPEKATPSDADEKTDGKATPSDADQQKPEKATPSDAYEKASDSDADEKINSKYRITDDGRLKLRACEHEHDEECGYYAWKTTYEYEDEEVKVKAVVVSENEEALPDGSELVVEKITEPEDIEYIARKIAEETGRSYDCSQAYDIRFEFGGDEVEPEDATVKVQLKYKEAVPVNEPGEVQAGEEAGNDIRVLHLTHDNQIEDVTGDISKNMAGDLKSATFETESFSIFVLTQVLPNGTFFQYEDEEKMITASVSNAAEIPSDAKLVVDVIGEEDERYAAAAAQLEQTAGLEGNSQRIAGTDLLIYEFYFLDFFDEKVEVDDTNIDLEITYKEPKALSSDGISTLSAAEHLKVSVYQVGVESGSEEINKSVTMEGASLKTLKVKTLGTGVLAIGRKAYPYDNRTIFDYGGSYSIAYILQNFCTFTEGDAYASDVVGPAAVGGKAYFPGSHGRAEYTNWTNSFYAGGFGTSHNFASGGKPLLYLSTSEQYDDALVRNDLKERNIIKINPDYIVFQDAFTQIKSQVSKLENDAIDLGRISIPTSQVYDKFAPGNVYKVENLNDINEININGGDATGNVIIIAEDSGHVNLPRVKINDLNIDSSEIGTLGISLVFVFPNASDVYAGRQNWYSPGGHVVAPNAVFHKTKYGNVGGSDVGQYNGCVIAKKLDAPGTEFHMHPYYGKLLETGVQFKLGKTVDTKTPESSEIFTFTLQNMTKDGDNYVLGSEIESVKNTGGAINFSPIIYNGAGTHYYCVSEQVSTTNNDYIYDENRYYIKVVIEGTVDGLGEQTGWEPTEITYWKVDKDGIRMSEDITASIPLETSLKMVIDLTQDSTTPAVFENKTNEGVVLPETGSAGTRKFTYTGFWLFMMGLMGMMYSGQERKRKVRN